MACKYWYAGKLHTEEEFKNILNNGLIDQLVKNKTVDLKDFEINEEQLKEFNNLRKSPITLRIRRKIQTRINNERTPLTGEFVNNNPLDVIQKSVEQGGKKFELLFVIKTKEGLQAGNTAMGKKIVEELESSPVGIANNLEEGIPYMLIPSAYGLYPIRVKSHKIKDIKNAAAVIQSALSKLSKTTQQGEIDSARKAIENILYRTTVEFSNGIFTIKNFDTKSNKVLVRTFNSVEAAYNFLGDRLYRIDYTKINKGTYNTLIASNGAVTTDLYSVDGNFFNSSSFVLEAYQTIETDKEQLDKFFDFEDTSSEATQTTQQSAAAQNIQTSGPSNNKGAESVVFEMPIDEVNKTLEGVIVREYPVPNSNQQVRVTGAVVNGTFQVVKVEGIQRTKRQNQNDSVNILKNYTSGTEYNNAVTTFFKDPIVQKAKEATKAKETTTTDIKTKKADIERRRQEELNKYPALYKNATTKEELQKVVKDWLDIDILSQTGSTPNVRGALQTPGGFERGKELFLEEQKYDIAFANKEINAKYDAELAALEGITAAEEVAEQATQSFIQRAAEAFATQEEPEPKPKTRRQMMMDEASDVVGEPIIVPELSGDIEFEGFDISELGLPVTGERPEGNDVKLRTTEAKGEVANFEQELSDLENMIGDAFKRGKKGTIKMFKDVESLRHYLPKETYEMLLEARRHGKEIHGVFTQAAMYLSRTALPGTTYHEAFHIVFTLALPLKTRVKILNEALEKYSDELPIKETKNPQTGEVKRTLPTYLEIEEVLADKFMEYVQQAPRTNYKEFSLTEGTKELGKSFIAMSKMLQVFFSPNRAIDIDQLFKDINMGVYKHSVKFRKTVMPEGTRLMATTSPDLRYDNVMEEIYAFGYLETLMDETLNEFRTKIGDNTINDKDVINKLGVHKMYSTILTKLVQEYQSNKAKNKLDRANLLGRLYKILTDNQTAFKLSEENGIKFLEFTRTTDLLARFNQSLQYRGLYMTYTMVKNSTSNETSEEDTSVFQKAEEGESTFEDAWMTDYITMNPHESISTKLKGFFATIPKYKSNRKNAAKVISPFGVVVKEDPNAVFKYLISKISNSYTMDDMMEKLSALESNKPYIKDILEKLDADPILKTQLWVNVASKNYAKFVFVLEDNGDYSVVNSNRKTLNDVIKEELIANFLQPDNKLLESDGLTPKKDEATKLLNALTAIKNYLLTNRNREGKALTQEDILKVFSDLSKVAFQNNNINITAADLEAIWNPEKGRASMNNITGLIDTVTAIAKELEAGNNPFTSLLPETVVTKEIRKTGKSLVEKLAKQLLPVTQNEVVSSFRNIDGKTVYNLILSNFLDKQMDKFKDPEKFQEYINTIKEDELIFNMPFIKDLGDLDLNLQKKLEHVIIDGLSRSGKKKSVGYTEMSDIEIEATSMALFNNSGSYKGKNKVGYFKLPIPSDGSTSAYIKSSVFERPEIIDRLVTTAQAEFLRIKKMQSLGNSSKLSRIKNFGKNADSFQILSFLNGKIDTKKGFPEAKVREAIEEFLNEDISKSDFFKLQIEQYKKKGIIKSVDYNTGAIIFAENIMDKKISSTTDKVAFFKNYLLNTYYMNTQLTTILGGDPAFYKNTVDFQKRFKQVMSPGLFTDVSESKKTYSGPILKDSIVPTKKETAKHITELIKQSNLTSQEKKELEVLWSTVLSNPDSKDYKGNNESDGATFISVERRKQQLEDLGRWTPEHEAAMKRIKNGTETIEDITLISPPFKPEKPFVSTKRIVDGKVVPTMIKNAETVLTKSFAYKKDADGKFMFPKLKAMYDDFVEGKFDVVYFESAIKVGRIVNLNGEFSDYELQPDGSYALSEDAEMITINSEDWRLQQETPDHYIDDSALFGTQLRVLITGDMDLEGTYTVAGKSYKGAELAKLYQELVVEDLRTSFEEVKQMFMSADGKTINYESLLTVLRQEVIDKELGQEYLDALAPITDVLGNTTSALPLYHPLISYKMESLMNSFFKNRITKQKINGGNLINTTSFGVSEHLEIEVDPVTGAITYQAMLPATSKKFFPKDKNGEVDLAAIEKNAPELLRIIGYRIPTEDKYSMFNIKIIGFTPPSMGGTAILPVEITTIAGLDFDIDKLYFMSRAFTLTANGNPKTIKYTEDPQEIAENIFRSFKDFKAFVLENVTKVEDQNRMIENHREILEKAIEERKEFKTANTELYNEIQNLKVELKAAKKMNSPMVKFIQDTLDAQYETLQEKFIPFQEDVLLQEKSKKLLDYIKTKVSKNFDPVKYNTKQARDNKKLDIVQGILENKHTSTMILNPGSFVKLKEQSAKIRLLQAGKTSEANSLTGEALIKAADNLDNQDFNINYPSTQLELYRRNMTGKQLIGIFANHNTHHAKAQYTNLSLATSIELDGEQFLALNKTTNKDGQRISKLLASSLAAVVDNASDPISSFLNLNTFTANSVALMQRLGVKEPTIFALINQPVILELTQRYFNERGSLSDEKHFAEIQNKWRSALKKKLKEAGLDEKNINNVELNQEVLEKNLVSDGSTDYYIVQLSALNMFNNLYEIANELGQGIGASKVDTVGVGPTSATNYTMLRQQERILEKRTPRVIGLEQVFLGGADQLLVPAFTKYGLHGPINILNKINPSIGTVSSKGDVNYSVLGELKNFFAGQKPNGFLSEKEANMVDVHFMNFIASKFPFFAYSQSEDILFNMPKKLLDFKKAMPENAPYKPFIDKLYVVEANKYSPIRRIEFYSTGKSAIENQQLKYAWQRALEDTNPEIKQFAQDLVKYTYFTNGYGFGPYSFANMVPVKFWTDDYQLRNKIVDKQGRPFNEFLKDALSEKSLLNAESPWKNRFINQFIRNNGGKEPFLMTVKEDVVLKKEKEGTSEASLNIAATEEAYNSKKGVVLTSKGLLIINTSKNSHLIINGKPVKYIKRYVQGQVKFYEHIETSYDQKNPADFDNRKFIDTITYKPISSLGTPNFTLEYDFDNDIQNSILAKRKVNAPIKQMSAAAQLAAEQDAIMAQIQAEAMAGMLPAELGQSLTSLTSPTVPPITTPQPRRRGGIDIEATNRSAGLFESLNWKDYKELGGKLPQDEFIKLPLEEQEEIISQLKNCK